MRSGIWRAWIVPLALLGSACFSDAGAQKLEGRVVEHTLDNGMKLILMERPTAPVLSAVLRFKVGSVDEEDGKTGLAHLYEHLAFRGTETVGTLDYERELEITARIDSLESLRSRLLGGGAAGDAESVRAIDGALERERAELDKILVTEELDRIYNLNGAVGLDATTTADLTTFMVDLPANRLALWAILESDRMAHSVPRKFDVERRIVAEERAARIDDDAESTLYREYLAAAFRVHAYRRPVPGWAGDLEAVRLEEARAFYETYYAPGNAVAAIVGDIDVEQVIALAETTFGRVPARDLPARAVRPEPGQTEGRSVEVDRRAQPALFMGFHKPAITHRDDRAFEILSEILTRGGSARLHRSLFVDKQIAMDVASWIGPGDRYPNLFTIAARPIWPHTADEVAEAIWVELGRMREEPVSEVELRTAKNRLETDFLRRLRNNRGMAEALSYYEMTMGSWRHLEDRLSEIESIGPEEIMDCARRYFRRENCTVGAIRCVGRDQDE